jgi:hypothetical protein
MNCPDCPHYSGFAIEEDNRSCCKLEWKNNKCKYERPNERNKKY